MLSRLLLVFILGLGLAGCGGSAPQWLPVVNASMQGAKGVSEVGKAVAVESKNGVGCYVAASMVSALDSASMVVNDVMADKPVAMIPAVSIDMAACYEVAGAPDPLLVAESAKKVEEVYKMWVPALFSVIETVLAAKDVECKDLVVVEAVMAYMNGLVPAVIAELSAPDGKVEVPEVQIAWGKCG